MYTFVYLDTVCKILCSTESEPEPLKRASARCSPCTTLQNQGDSLSSRQVQENSLKSSRRLDYLVLDDRRIVLIDVTKDLPDITRLNTVHHEGVPREHVSEHFVFVFLSSVAYMTFDKKKGLYCIKFRGYLGKWYPKILTYYQGYNYNKAVEKWSKLCMMISSSQNRLYNDRLQGCLF